MLVLNTVTQHVFYIDDYPETFISKIYSRICAINMHSMPADMFVGTIADYLGDMHHNVFMAIASVLVCLCNDQATPVDIYASRLPPTACTKSTRVASIIRTYMTPHGLSPSTGVAAH